MDRKTAAGIILGVSVIIPAAAASAEITYTTLQQDAVIYTASGSTQFTAWAMLFAVGFICLLLSVYVSKYRDFSAFLALTVFIACSLLVPSLISVDFATQTVLLDNDTLVATTVTPLVTEMGSLPMMLMCIFFIIVAGFNALRAMLVIVADASVDRRQNDFDQSPADFPKDEDIKNAGANTNQTSNVFRKNNR